MSVNNSITRQQSTVKSPISPSHNRSLSGSSSTSADGTGSSTSVSNMSSPTSSATTSPTLAAIHNIIHQKSSSTTSGAANKHLSATLVGQKQFNSSLDDLKNQLEGATLIDLGEVEGEVVINEEYDSYEYDDDDDDDEYEEDDSYDDEQNRSGSSTLDRANNRSTESLPEEEELSINPRQISSLPSIKPDINSPMKRGYSHTISGYSGSPPGAGVKPSSLENRLERSESTVYHETSDLPVSPIGHRGNSEKVVQAKDKISSDYKKILEDPEAFRNEKLKQRKSKFFSKKDLEELPFAPSSGTLLRSNIYKQFMTEKIDSISNSPDKYKSELLKSYINNLKLNTPKDELVAKKKVKVNRNRSQSTPPVNTSLANNKQAFIGTLESIIEKENKRDNTIRKLPLLISKCIEYLSNETALTTEGLFRVGGNAGDVENLMKALLLYGTPIPDNTCVHAVSNTIKKFLRQLTVPLFTFTYHNNFIQLTKLSTDQEKVEEIKKLLKLIPSPNQLLIQELSKFLIKVTEYSSKNMMHSYNLGLMFGPNVMRPPEENEFNTMSTMLDSQSQIWTLILENYQSIYS